jgi:hypothetical protein
MKIFSYSKEKRFRESLIVILSMLFFTCFLVLFEFINDGTFLIGLSIFIFIYQTYFQRQIISITVYENFLEVKQRKYLFLIKRIKISEGKGIYQYWDHTHYRYVSKDYIYIIKKNGYQLFRITPSDTWEKETIEDLIKEVKKIGIPLKGNLKDTIGD